MSSHRNTAGGGPTADKTFDALVYEVQARLGAGEQVHLDDYADRGPEHVERLRKLLPTLQAMADLGHSLAGPDAGFQAEKEDLGRVPNTLGDFRIIREVGRGGMGVVYEAEQVSLKRRVALKVLPFAAVLDQRQLGRFTREAEAAGALHHQNIVPVYSVGCERGVHYYAMQFVDGQTLGALVGELRQRSGLDVSGEPTTGTTASAKPLAERTTRSLPGLATTGSTTTPAFFGCVAQLGIQIAEALDHAHQQGVVHRDIKPSNLMVDAAGKPWITDFGLAHVEAGPSLTVSGDLLGTLRYMSPEQALAKRVVIDHRSDIYSLGVTLYELLTLRPVFSGRDRRELLRQIAFDEPRPPRKLNKAIPTDLETIILKAMAKNPAERYATAQELADDLRRFLDVKPIRARRPTVLQRMTKWARRHTPLVWSAAALLVMATVGSLIAATLIWNKQKELKESNEALSTALHNEETQRKLAEGNLKLALEALDKVFIRVTESKRWGLVQDEREWHAALLRDALEFRERLGETNIDLAKPNPHVEKARRILLSLWGELVQDRPDGVGYLRSLATARIGFGAWLQTAGRGQDAEAMCRDGLVLREELAKSFPSIPEYRRELEDGHRALADVLESTGRNEEAEQHRQDARQLRDTKGPPPAAEAVSFADFRDPSLLTLIKDASVSDGRLCLSPAGLNRHGAAWLTEKQSVSAGFETTFRFQTSGRNNPFAFVIQNHGLSALGRDGSGMGYGGFGGPDDADGTGGIPNSLAVGFDANRHAGHPYVLGRHVAIQTGGLGPNSTHPAWSLGSARPEVDPFDGEPHVARIRYVPGRLDVFLDDEADPVLSVPVDLAATLSLGAGRAWVGFTAATHAPRATREILSWDYRPLADAAMAGTAEPPPIPQARSPKRKAPSVTEEDMTFLRDALGFYSDFAHQNPADTKAQLEAGKAYWRVGEIRLKEGHEEKAVEDYATALRFWEKLATDFPHVSEHGRHLARGYDRRTWVLGHQLKRYDEALADLTRWLELRPRDAAAYRRRAYLYTELKQDKRAAADLSMASKIVSEDDPHHDRGHSYSRDGQFAKAAAEFSKAIERRPNDAHLIHDRGTVYLRLKQHDKALADLSRAVNLDASNAVTWSNRSAAHSGLGRWAEAAADLSKAIELTPWRMVYRSNRGGIYFNLGEFSKAFDDFSKAVKQKPEQGWTWYRRGNAHAQSGRWDEAAADMRKAIELTPHQGRFAWHHAMMPLGAGNVDRYRERCERLLTRFAEAEGGHAVWAAWACVLVPDAVADPAGPVRLAETALRADPKDDTSLITLGAALYRAGRFDEATRRFEEVHAVWDQAEVKPTADCYPAYTWFLLAMAHQRHGDAEGARRWLDKAAQWTEKVLQEGTLPSGIPLRWSCRLILELLRREAEATVVARRDVEPAQQVRDASEAMRAAVRKAAELYEQRERTAREERQRVVREAWSPIAALAEGEINQTRADQLLRRIDDLGARVPADDIPADVREQIEALCSRAEQAAGSQRLFDGKTLNGWRVADEVDYVKHGIVVVDAGKIFLAPGRRRTAIAWAGTVPTGDYEISLEAMRVAGGGGFCNVVFPVGLSRCTLIVGGYGGRVVGLDQVDGRRADGNLTARWMDFERGRWYRVRLRVTQARIAAWIDGGKVVDIERAGHKFTLDAALVPLSPLGVDALLTTAALRNIRWRRLSGPVVEPKTATTVSFTTPFDAQGLQPICKGDGLFVAAERDGKAVLHQQVGKPGNGYLYFWAVEGFAEQFRTDVDRTALLSITLLDTAPGLVSVDYDSHGGRWTHTARQRLRGTGQWVDVAFRLPRARFGHRQNYGADFRIWHNADLIVHRVAVAVGGRSRVEPSAVAPFAGKPGEWVSLFDGKTLTGWRVADEGDYATHGKVGADAGKIVLASGKPRTGIAWTGGVPTVDYEISLEATRVAGEADFCSVVFPVGFLRCTLIVGGYGGRVVGLDEVDGRGADQNPTTRRMDFERGRWYRVRLRVTQARIEAWVDGGKTVDIERAGHEFNLKPVFVPLSPLGVDAYRTTAALRNIRLRRLGRNGDEDDNK